MLPTVCKSSIYISILSMLTRYKWNKTWEGKGVDETPNSSQSSCSSSIAMADTMSHFAQNVDSSYLEELGGGLESKDEGETVGNLLRIGGANRGYISPIDIPEGKYGFAVSFNIFPPYFTSLNQLF